MIYVGLSVLQKCLKIMWKAKLYFEREFFHSLSIDGFVAPRKESTSLCNNSISFFNTRLCAALWLLLNV